MMQKQILETFFSIVLQKGWKETSLEDVSLTLNLPLENIIQCLPSKNRAFPLLANVIESELRHSLVKESISPYPEKERAMEIILSKLELMTPFKPFLVYLRTNALSQTEISLPFAMAEFSSLERLLMHYGFNQESLLSELKRKGLFGIYLLTLDTWLEDKTPDLGPTLSKLDWALSKGEVFLERYS